MPHGKAAAQRTVRTGLRHDALMLNLIATGFVLLIIFLVYYESYRSMVSVWLNTDTYLHGFVVFPISIYLVWHKWPELRQMRPAPFLPGALVLFSLSLLWLMSDFLGIQVGKHFTIVAMVPAAVLTITGLRFTQKITFPLVYLLFAVPFGEALIPGLIDITATFTVKALNVTGIPVVRDGPFFSIPSGNFEVAKACSGIRYLLAALSLGTLYGYISFHSFGKRAAFFLFSLILPIIANGFRAYGIVMLAHYSDMKIAVGVDHVIFGWIFFGIVMTIMFLVGNKFHDAPLESGPSLGTTPTSFPSQLKKGRRVTMFVLPLALTCAVAGPILGLMISPGGHSDLSENAKLPDNVPDWQGSDLYDQDFRPNFLGASRKLYARYVNGGDRVNLAVIQYDGHRQNAELANDSNSVLDESIFLRVGHATNLSLDLLSVGHVDMQEVIAIRGGMINVIWYWFQVNDQPVVSPLEIKLQEARNLFAGKKSVSTAVIVSVGGLNDIGTARSVLQKFMDASYGPINKCLILDSSHPDCSLGNMDLEAN